MGVRLTVHAAQAPALRAYPFRYIVERASHPVISATAACFSKVLGGNTPGTAKYGFPPPCTFNDATSCRERAALSDGHGGGTGGGKAGVTDHSSAWFDAHCRWVYFVFDFHRQAPGQARWAKPAPRVRRERFFLFVPAEKTLEVSRPATKF